MIKNKSIMVQTLLLIKEKLEVPVTEEVYLEICEFINKIYNSPEYTTYDKQIIEYIISIILSKSNINDYEKDILILIISKIEDKNNFREENDI